MTELIEALVDFFRSAGRLVRVAAIKICGLMIQVAQTAVVTLGHLKTWLSTRDFRARVNPNEVAFSVVQAINENNFAVVGGFFDLETNKVTDAMALQSTDVDPAIRQMHAGKPIALMPANEQQRASLQKRFSDGRR